MDWTQTITIIGVMGALFSVFATMMYWLVSRLDSDIKAIGSDVKSCTARLDGHAMRIDQLYKIIVDLLKEGRK
jgi:hypothetical protein